MYIYKDIVEDKKTMDCTLYIHYVLILLRHHIRTKTKTKRKILGD